MRHYRLSGFILGITKKRETKQEFLERKGQELSNPPKRASKPPAFPMKFKVYIRWMVPGPRQHSARLHIFRQFLYASFAAGEYYQAYQSFPRAYPLIGYNAEETDATRQRMAESKADDLIARLSRDGVARPEDGVDFFETMRAIVRWRAKRKIQQRKDARASRTLKNYRKKILWLLLDRISAPRN